jgi:mRNA interferase HigB
VNQPLLLVFNIINRRTLLAYCRLYPVAAVALQQWYAELLTQDFTNFNQLKLVYAAASVVGDDRVVFNIMGNKYRLVVRFVFAYKTIQIKWFGTHHEYDKIDVSTVQFRTA